MDAWHGYFIINRRAANLGAGNWSALLALVDSIQSGGIRSDELLHYAAKVDGDARIYEALYPANAVEFEQFRVKLVNVFEVPDGDVTYVTSTQTFDTRASVFATYRYQGVNRFDIGLFGCPDESALATRAQSRVEALAYVVANDTDWHAP